MAPRFSANGQWLAYASNQSGRYQVYVRPFPGLYPEVPISVLGGGQPVWSADGSRLFYRTEEAMWVADLTFDSVAETVSVSSRVRLFGGAFFGGPASPRATYDVHPDGRRFLLAREAGGGGAAIVVWQDWLAELKERLAEG